MYAIVENDIIKAELQDGLSQVDENLVIDELENAYDKKTRKMIVYLKVVNKKTGETMEIVV